MPPSARKLSPPPAARASYPVRPGNAVRAWIDGTPTLTRLSRALDAAEHSAWLCLAHASRDAVLPGGSDTLFERLERAAARGLDMRVLCWREPREPELEPGVRPFSGDVADREFLRSRAPHVRIRWDRLADGFCQHQKLWLFDAGEAGERAFVGGLSPVAGRLSEPGYAPRVDGNSHDLVLELEGPAATDAHHNFVQRWNEASEREARDGCWPDAATAGPLRLPVFVTRPRGEVPVQLTRTLPPKMLRDDTPAPGAKPFAVSGGEQSALEQIVSAVASAERTLYVENQAIASPIVVEELRRALARGVRVVYLVPGAAHPAFAAARRDPRAAPFFEQLAALGDHEHFTLAALCAHRGDGRYEDIAVHAMVAIADDLWAAVGSTNVAERSFRHDTELNASFWHPDTVRALRRSLFANALGLAPERAEALGEVEAFDLYRATAGANLDRRALWEPLAGFVYAIDPAQYGA